MRLFPAILFSMLCLVLISCSHLTTDQSAGTDPAQSQSETMPATSGPSDYYYDFDDILVPKEMELLTQDSFILETPSSKSGVMVFTGRVELTSLSTFFINNMAKDGWSPCSMFKSSRTILVFEKNERYCIINITDGKLRTLLEIWVSPRVGSGGTSQILAPETTTHTRGTRGGASVKEGRLTQ